MWSFGNMILRIFLGRTPRSVQNEVWLGWCNPCVCAVVEHFSTSVTLYCFSLPLFIFLSVRLSCLSLFLSLFSSLSVSLPACLSVCLSISLCISLSVCVCVSHSQIQYFTSYPCFCTVSPSPQAWNLLLQTNRSGVDKTIPQHESMTTMLMVSYVDCLFLSPSSPSPSLSWFSPFIHPFLLLPDSHCRSSRCCSIVLLLQGCAVMPYKMRS